jgi:hypothetical protein
VLCADGLAQLERGDSASAARAMELLEQVRRA